MAFLQLSFHAATIGQHTNVNVVLPDSVKAGERVPVLYLLHGLSDDQTMWSRRTSVERYAAPYRLAIVMPAGHRSFYTNTQSGERFFDYITEELPARMESFFPVSTERSGRFIAGLSMGGYGAFKAALNRPDLYAAAASFSGALGSKDIAHRFSEPLVRELFGSPEAAAGRPHNLYLVAEDVARNAADTPCPILYQACGTEDFLHTENVSFRDHLRSLGLPLTYFECPGAHEWGFWDARIRDTLAWLPLPENRHAVSSTDALPLPPAAER